MNFNKIFFTIDKIELDFVNETACFVGLIESIDDQKTNGIIETRQLFGKATFDSIMNVAEPHIGRPKQLEKIDITIEAFKRMKQLNYEDEIERDQREL
jgi:hypothetical protein